MEAAGSNLVDGASMNIIEDIPNLRFQHGPAVQFSENTSLEEDADIICASNRFNTVFILKKDGVCFYKGDQFIRTVLDCHTTVGTALDSNCLKGCMTDFFRVSNPQLCRLRCDEKLLGVACGPALHLLDVETATAISELSVPDWIHDMQWTPMGHLFCVTRTGASYGCIPVDSSAKTWKIKAIELKAVTAVGSFHIGDCNDFRTSDNFVLMSTKDTLKLWEVSALGLQKTETMSAKQIDSSSLNPLLESANPLVEWSIVGLCGFTTSSGASYWSLAILGENSDNVIAICQYDQERKEITVISQFRNELLLVQASELDSVRFAWITEWRLLLVNASSATAFSLISNSSVFGANGTDSGWSVLLPEEGCVLETSDVTALPRGLCILRTFLDNVYRTHFQDENPIMEKPAAFLVAESSGRVQICFADTHNPHSSALVLPPLSVVVPPIIVDSSVYDTGTILKSISTLGDSIEDASGDNFLMKSEVILPSVSNNTSGSKVLEVNETLPQEELPMCIVPLENSPVDEFTNSEGYAEDSTCAIALDELLEHSNKSKGFEMDIMKQILLGMRCFEDSLLNFEASYENLAVEHDLLKSYRRTVCDYGQEVEALEGGLASYHEYNETMQKTLSIKLEKHYQLAGDSSLLRSFYIEWPTALNELQCSDDPFPEALEIRLGVFPGISALHFETLESYESLMEQLTKRSQLLAHRAKLFNANDRVKQEGMRGAEMPRESRKDGETALEKKLRCSGPRSMMPQASGSQKDNVVTSSFPTQWKEQGEGKATKNPRSGVFGIDPSFLLVKDFQEVKGEEAAWREKWDSQSSYRTSHEMSSAPRSTKAFQKSYRGHAAAASSSYKQNQHKIFGNPEYPGYPDTTDVRSRKGQSRTKPNSKEWLNESIPKLSFFDKGNIDMSKAKADGTRDNKGIKKEFSPGCMYGIEGANDLLTDKSLHSRINEITKRTFYVDDRISHLDASLLRMKRAIKELDCISDIPTLNSRHYMRSYRIPEVLEYSQRNVCDGYDVLNETSNSSNMPLCAMHQFFRYSVDYRKNILLMLKLKVTNPDLRNRVQPKDFGETKEREADSGRKNRLGSFVKPEEKGVVDGGSGGALHPAVFSSRIEIPSRNTSLENLNLKTVSPKSSGACHSSIAPTVSVFLKDKADAATTSFTSVSDTFGTMVTNVGGNDTAVAFKEVKTALASNTSKETSVMKLDSAAAEAQVESNAVSLAFLANTTERKSGSSSISSGSASNVASKCEILTADVKAEIEIAPGEKRVTSSPVPESNISTPELNKITSTSRVTPVDKSSPIVPVAAAKTQPYDKQAVENNVVEHSLASSSPSEKLRHDSTIGSKSSGARHSDSAAARFEASISERSTSTSGAKASKLLEGLDSTKAGKMEISAGFDDELFKPAQPIEALPQTPGPSNSNNNIFQVEESHPGRSGATGSDAKEIPSFSSAFSGIGLSSKPLNSSVFIPANGSFGSGSTGARGAVTSSPMFTGAIGASPDASTFQKALEAMKSPDGGTKLLGFGDSNSGTSLFQNSPISSGSSFFSGFRDPGMGRNVPFFQQSSASIGTPNETCTKGADHPFMVGMAAPSKPAPTYNIEFDTGNLDIDNGSRHEPSMFGLMAGATGLSALLGNETAPSPTQHHFGSTFGGFADYLPSSDAFQTQASVQKLDEPPTPAPKWVQGSTLSTAQTKSRWTKSRATNPLD